MQPDDLITRAQGLRGLHPEFMDEVPIRTWGYVNATVYAGVINGYENSTSRAGNPVTYGEAVPMLVRAIPGHLAQVPRGPWPYNFLFYAAWALPIGRPRASSA